MGKETIDFGWKENMVEKHITLNREKLYGIMDGIRKGFPDDNEISSHFCEIIIPTADSIFIDKDRNCSKEEPFISYSKNGIIKVLPIKRYHKVIWSILDRYCK